MKDEKDKSASSHGDANTGENLNSPESEARQQAKAEVGEKANLRAMVEDPYVQYLIETKARAQARAFLKGAAAVILAILVYSGWEFKSAKDEINKRMAEINTDVENRVKRVQAENEKAQEYSRNAGNSSDEAKRLVADATYNATTSTQTLRLAQANLESSKSQSEAIIRSMENAQRSFFEQQRQILAGIDLTTGMAKQSVVDARKILSDLQTLDVPNKVEEVNRRLQELAEVRDRIRGISNQVNADLGSAKNTVESVKTLEQINQLVIKAQTSEYIMLREYDKQVVILPNIRLDGEALGPSYFNPEPQYLKFTFEAKELGKNFVMAYTIEPVDQDGIQISDSQIIKGNWEVKFKLKMSENEKKDYLIKVFLRTPFRARIQQVYFGRWAPEFVTLRIEPRAELKPAKITTETR